ncbi:MAG: Uma2 family endonuclease, partial [Planctomycetota bacterium]|nr:Uma2 family endonuclease [Planctomycetota bacterium]
LYKVPGKAEIVEGRIQTMSPAGADHGYAAGEIFASLREHAKQTGRGRAVPDNVGFIVDLPGRRSFSPDAAYYTGPTGGSGFYPAAPDFAVEIRSEEDYGPAAEARLAKKRQEYFAAGTLVVWDVDLRSKNDIVRVYRNNSTPTGYGRDQVAEAEPAVPGWTLAVAELFDSAK